MFVLPDNRVINGRLYITNFRLFFKSIDQHQISNDQPNFIIIDLPLGLINRIEKIGHQSSKHVNFYGLSISCKVIFIKILFIKDFLDFNFIISSRMVDV